MTDIDRGTGPARGRDAETGRYGAVSRVNHWLVGLLFLGALGLGLTFGYADLQRETTGALMPFHQALGVSVLLLGLWRVVWRIAQGFPEPASLNEPRWQRMAAMAAHWGLLAALLLMPLSGITMTIAGGRALEIFGVVLLPSAGEIGWLDAAASWTHGTVGLVAALLVALHVAAALKHHFIDGDATLRRMTHGVRE